MSSIPITNLAPLINRSAWGQAGRFGQQVDKEADALPLAVDEPEDSYASKKPPRTIDQAGPLKAALGTIISAISLALSLLSMGMINIPKVPLLSLPFFGLVMGAFAVNEALIAAAEAYKIPTVHHSESLKKILTLPSRVFSKSVMETIWPVFYGGQAKKQETIQSFLDKSEQFVTQVSKGLIQNPLFEDLSAKLRDKRNFSDKAVEILKSAGKVLLTLSVASVLPKSLRLAVGPWLTQALGFPVLDQIWKQLDQDPNTPGTQLSKPKNSSASSKLKEPLVVAHMG